MRTINFIVILTTLISSCALNVQNKIEGEFRTWKIIDQYVYGEAQRSQFLDIKVAVYPFDSLTKPSQQLLLDSLAIKYSFSEKKTGPIHLQFYKANEETKDLKCPDIGEFYDNYDPNVNFICGYEFQNEVKYGSIIQFIRLNGTGYNSKSKIDTVSMFFNW